MPAKRQSDPPNRAELQMARLIEHAVEVLRDVPDYAKQCHGASHAIVKDAPVPCRVARGTSKGVGGQHSWVVLGMDCYDPDALVLDPTLAFWRGEVTITPSPRTAEDVRASLRTGRNLTDWHPHGWRSIWDWGRPPEPTGPEVTLTPRTPWSQDAIAFLDILGPLDEGGWRILAGAPAGQWPAGEIFDAMASSGFEAAIPIDILGMTTLRDPGGLYLRTVDAVPVPEDADADDEEHGDAPAPA